MITLQVDPERKEFIIYKTVTCNLVDYLKETFQNRFTKAQSGIIVMAEDRPETVSLFVSWTYRRTAPAGNTETHLHKLFNLYIFADKICLVARQDIVVDRIQDMCMKYKLEDKHITPALWAKILDNRPVSRGLKRFCIHLMVYCYKKRALASPQPYTRSVYGTEEYDGPETAT
ncbi:hypothetical protein ACEPPN_011908 [Leptodophora sp. 'Broadleaf-Isolate-01']